MAEARLSLSTPAETSLTDSGNCNNVEFCDPRDDRSGFSALCSLLPRDDRPAMCSPHVMTNLNLVALHVMMTARLGSLTLEH